MIIGSQGGLTDRVVSVITPTTTDDLICCSTYIHNQITPSTSWVINHLLNKYPSVSVIDSSGNLVITDVVYINTMSLSVNFSSAFGGKAYLN